MHFNIRSLSKNISSIEDLIYECLDKYPDIICISETKLNEKSDLSLIQIPDYKFIHNDSKTAAGGSGIYINESLTFSPRNDLNININGECEATFVEIHVKNTNEKNIIIGSVYRHPHDNYDQFFSVFCETIERVNKQYNVILLGDININVNANDCKSKEYKDLLLSMGLNNCITLPTRISDSSETVIDHLVTNINPNLLLSGVITEEITDHLPIFGIVQIRAKHTTPNHYYTRRNITLTKKDSFVRCIVSKINSFTYENDPSTTLQKLVHLIQSASDQVFPSNKKKRSKKRYRKNWITAGILTSIDNRDKLFEKWKNNKTPENRATYNRKRNQVTRIKDIAKESMKHQKVEEAGSDVKKIWKCINNFLKKKTNKGNNLPDKLITDGSNEIKESQHVINHLNQRFVKKGPRLANRLPQTNRSVLEGMGNPNSASMEFQNINSSEISSTPNHH